MVSGFILIRGMLNSFVHLTKQEKRFSNVNLSFTTRRRKKKKVNKNLHLRVIISWLMKQLSQSYN